MDSVESSPTSTAEDIVANSADAGGSDVSNSQSALRENISKKGKNAYYYAHAHKATGPKWDGKIEPRLLGTSSSNLTTDPATGGGLAPNRAALMAKSNITNYAFLDEGAKVKIYVNLPGVGSCGDGDIALDFTKRSLCFTVKNYVSLSATVAKREEKKEDVGALVADTAPEEENMTMEEGRAGQDRCLSFGQLFGEIENATFRKKPDKVIITLKKADFRTWTKVIG